MPDEKATIAIVFLHRARAWLTPHGITRIERVVTGNSARYRAEISPEHYSMPGTSASPRTHHCTTARLSDRTAFWPKSSSTPGRGHRKPNARRQDRRAERCLEDIGELADRIAVELRPWRGRSLALFGHSMGAVLAFEVAQRLENEPVRLFASGRRAPSLHRDERVHLRDDDGLVAELRDMSGTASWVLGDDELLRMILPATRSDYRAVETYRCTPGARVDCPITVLTGDADPKVTVDEAKQWSGHTTGETDLRVFPGGHFYLAERQKEVLAVLGEQLGLRSPASN
ncbi:thioesterase II family protein [Streptomyces noursei]|uniref:thioesterase II family protein n=1 Tax=Streptomyces noursei TaxID=1971 RepID=UPI0035560F67